MRKNQKYNKEETCPTGRRVYLTIELWQERDLSQVKFCSREKPFGWLKNVLETLN